MTLLKYARYMNRLEVNHDVEDKSTKKNVWACPVEDSISLKYGFEIHFDAFYHPLAHKRFQRGVNYIGAEDSICQIADNIREFTCFDIENYREPNHEHFPDELIQCSVGSIRITVLIDSSSKIYIPKGDDWKLLCNQNAIAWNITSNPTDVLEPHASLKIECCFNTTINFPSKSNTIITFYVVWNGGYFIDWKSCCQSVENSETKKSSPKREPYLESFTIPKDDKCVSVVIH